MRQVLFTALLALAACSTPAAEQPTAPPAAETPPNAGPPAAGETADACGADAMQHLVGRPRSEIPVPVKPQLQRVACTTCAITLDFNPNRLNFFFDAETGIIKQVRCG
jgi:hypothetical protein